MNIVTASSDPVSAQPEAPDRSAAVNRNRVPTYLGRSMAALIVPPIGVAALHHSIRARRCLASDDRPGARINAARAKEWCWYALAAAILCAFIAFLAAFLTANHAVIVHKFFDPTVLKDALPSVLKGFWLNVEMFLIVEALVLPWGLLIALIRQMPGRAGRPVRAIAVAYIDVFRGLPAVIAIYLIAFGFPLTGLPIISFLSPFWLCVFALTLTYGAYIAEVFRAGLESVHPSQIAAARSLGLTQPQTMRYVILPQAVRRVIPPLLNDFIGLQKDTSLVSFVGLLDGFNRARIVASNEFNLSAVTGIGLAFVLITIPTTRLVDHLLARDRRRMSVSTR